MRKLALIGMLGLAGCTSETFVDDVHHGGAGELPRYVAAPDAGSFDVTVSYAWDRSTPGGLPEQAETTLFFDRSWFQLGGATALVASRNGDTLDAASLRWQMVQGYPSATVDFSDLSFRFIDEDGDGRADRIEGEGTGIVFAWWGDYGGTYPFTATFAGTPDRTPPSLTTNETELTPFSTLHFDASDDTSGGEVSVTVDGIPFEAEPRWFRGESGISLTVEPSQRLPWGGTVEVHVDGLHDGAGNLAEPFVWTAHVIDRPAAAPSPSFADGLTGYVAKGVQLTDAAALPIDDQGFGVIGYAGEPWSLLFEIEVPDTASPWLRTNVWTLPGGLETDISFELWSASAHDKFGAGAEPSSQPLASPVLLGYGSGAWAAEGEIDTISENRPVEVNLASMRGERAVVRISGGQDLMNYGPPMPLPLEAILLDGLRIDPE